MSRSGYNDEGDIDEWALIRWRGQVMSSIRGRRGQAFLKELVAALEAMPEKKLIRDELQDGAGNVCAIGSVGKARGVDMSKLDPEDPDRIAAAFNIAAPLVRELEYTNDDWWHNWTNEQRYEHVLEWAKGHIRGEDKA